MAIQHVSRRPQACCYPIYAETSSPQELCCKLLVSASLMKVAQHVKLCGPHEAPTYAHKSMQQL